jgi:hypothetical protein
MALSYKARRRWALVVLLVFMPLYIIFAAAMMSRVGTWFLDAGILGKILQFLIYVILGVAWVFPFKRVFMGVGQADPDADPND